MVLNFHFSLSPANHIAGPGWQSQPGSKNASIREGMDQVSLLSPCLLGNFFEEVLLGVRIRIVGRIRENIFPFRILLTW